MKISSLFCVKVSVTLYPWGFFFLKILRPKNPNVIVFMAHGTTGNIIFLADCKPSPQLVLE